MASPLRDLMAAAAGKLVKSDDTIFDLTALLVTLNTQLNASGISVNTNALATTYEAKTFTLAAPGVDYDVNAVEGLFATAHNNVRIKADGAFSFKINSPTANAIACSATEEFPIANISVTNLFITCGAGVTVRIVAI